MNSPAESTEPQMTADLGSVIVTGICGRMGRKLTRVLHRDRPVLGVDRRPFPRKPADVEHFELDLRSKRVRDVFRRPGVSAVVHLGTMHNPSGRSGDYHASNVLGFQKALELVRRYGIRKLVLLSSANVYGPRPDNPQFLTEDAPLLGAGPFSDIRDLVEIDMAAQSFLWQTSEVETVILRPTHIIGTVHNAPSNYLRLGVVPTLLGFDPMIQVVHEDDVVQALALALAPGLRGIFNIAGPPPLALSQALELLDRTSLPLPHQLAKFSLNRLFKLKVTKFPAPELDFIRYVCMVDDTRARTELGYKSTRGIEQTLEGVDAERWP